jgi:hypothetical protein
VGLVGIPSAALQGRVFDCVALRFAQVNFAQDDRGR